MFEEITCTRIGGGQFTPRWRTSPTAGT